MISIRTGKKRTINNLFKKVHWYIWTNTHFKLMCLLYIYITIKNGNKSQKQFIQKYYIEVHINCHHSSTVQTI